MSNSHLTLPLCSLLLSSRYLVAFRVAAGGEAGVKENRVVLGFVQRTPRLVCHSHVLQNT